MTVRPLATQKVHGGLHLRATGLRLLIDANLRALYGKMHMAYGVPGQPVHGTEPFEATNHAPKERR